MKHYKQHALSAAFPSMSEADLGILAVDIKAYGLHNPITIFEGQVIDGWHRWQACMQVKIKPEFVNLDDTTDPVAFVRSMNGHRRHLTGSQRAASEVALRGWAQTGKNQHQKEGGSLVAIEAQAPTSKEMAKAAGVSIGTIEHAKAAQKAGLGKDVVDGKISAFAAANKNKPKPQPAAPEDAPPNEADFHVEQMEDALEYLWDENARLTIMLHSLSIPEEDRAAFQLRMTEIEAENKHLHIVNRGLIASRNTTTLENNVMRKQLVAYANREKKSK